MPYKHPEIALHADGYGPGHAAICVKVRRMPDCDAPSEVCLIAYDRTVESFWFAARCIAQEHGYSDVFSEGRSAGWLVPFTQHDSTGKLVTRWTGQGPDKGYPVYPGAQSLWT